jgi:hypothetical protein
MQAYGSMGVPGQKHLGAVRIRTPISRLVSQSGSWCWESGAKPRQADLSAEQEPLQVHQPNSSQIIVSKKVTLSL